MSLNRVVIMGRLTAAPELKFTQNGLPVTTFSVAVDRAYKAGERPETDFFQVVAWRKTAEFAAQHFDRGDMIAIDGRLQSRSYTDKTQSKRVAYEIVADSVSFTGGKRQKDEGEHYAPPPGSQERTANEPAQTSAPDDMPFGTGFRSDTQQPMYAGQEQMPDASGYGYMDPGGDNVPF